VDANAKPAVILMDCEHRLMQGVISSFGKRGIEVIALSAQKDTPPPAFKSRFVSYTYISPDLRHGEEAYLEFLRELPHRGVLLFSTDWAAEFASKHQQAIREAGYLINIPDHEIFRRSFDKDRIFKVCAECDVPTMPTREVNSVEDIYAAAKAFGYPLLLKPTRLAGSRFQKIHRREEIQPAFDAISELVGSEEFAAQESGIIVQEFIHYRFDDLYCVEAYCAKDQSRQDILTIQKIRPDINYDGSVGSRIFAGQTLQVPDLEQYSRRLLEYLGWTGIAHLDWLYAPKYEDYLLCEINPRLPGFSSFPTKIGFEMAWYYYADLAGISTPTFRFKRALYFEALRHPGDLTSNLVAVFKGHLGFWPYIKPYLKILTLRYQVVVDVFYGADLPLTWENYKVDLRKLMAKFNRSIHV